MSHGRRSAAWIGSTLTACLIFLLLFALIPGFPGKTTIKRTIAKSLTVIHEPKPGDVSEAAYVLGGSPPSLLLKFKKVASLYRRTRCKRILIAYRPGKTEYDPKLKRNLTNNEWAITQLEKLDIPRDCIELVDIKKGFFGTYSEAKTISSLAVKRGYKSLLLVTAPHHTRRTLASFGYFLKGYPTRLYIEASREKAGLHELALEFFKLQIYRLFLISDKKESKTVPQTGSTLQRRAGKIGRIFFPLFQSKNGKLKHLAKADCIFTVSSGNCVRKIKNPANPVSPV